MKTRHENNGLRKLCEHPRRSTTKTTWAKCEHSWYFSFKWERTHHRFSLDRHLGRHIDSKTDAEAEAAILRAAIKAGKFGQPTQRKDMLLQQLTDLYFTRYVKVKRAATADDFQGGLNVICATVLPRPTGGTAPFGAFRLTDIVTDTVERYREARRALGTGPGGANRSLSRLRAVFSWAVKVGYMDATPFKRGTETAVELEDEHPRSRRLNADLDEEAKLLAACDPHLRAIVECGLETGMRKGESLSLQWKQVEGMKIVEGKVVWAVRAELFLPKEKTKTKSDRRIPISPRLRAILEMRRFDSTNTPHALEAYVFGTEIGTRILGFKRAWQTAVLTSHGVVPTYTATANLTPASRAALQKIDLHFHDLRREAGSRWLDGGMPLHAVRDLLGHSNISQTSVYLAGTAKTQHDAMRLYEERKAALQRIATEGLKGGQTGAQTATTEEEKPNETGVGRNTTIM